MARVIAQRLKFMGHLDLKLSHAGYLMSTTDAEHPAENDVTSNIRIVVGTSSLLFTLAASPRAVISWVDPW